MIYYEHVQTFHKSICDLEIKKIYCLGVVSGTYFEFENTSFAYLVCAWESVEVPELPVRNVDMISYSCFKVMSFKVRFATGELVMLNHQILASCM